MMGGDAEIAQLLDCLSELFDAAVHGEKAEENLRRLGELDEELERAVERLRLLEDRISGAVEEYVEESGDPDSKVFAESVAKFVSAAAKQEEARIRKRFDEEKRAAESAANSESELAKASMEVFLSRCPLRVEEKRFSLRLMEDSYVLACRYRFPGKIECEFLLDTKANPALAKPTTPATLGFKLRLPVGVGKSWLGQAAPQLLKLDKYVLSEAEAAENSLVYVLADEEDSSTLRVVYTKNERASAVSLTYRDESGQVDVTGNPALAKYLDSEGFKALSETLLRAILQLEPKKLKLTQLLLEGEDVFEKRKHFEFALRVLEALPVSPESLYTRALHAGLKQKLEALLKKIRGFGEKAPTLYAKLGANPPQGGRQA